MNDAMQQDNAWETLHGPHAVPKKYVPPFLLEENKRSAIDLDELDNVYDIEIEGVNQVENIKS